MLMKVMQVLIILKFFNPKLQVKDTEFSIGNKLMDWLTESKGFKFVTTLFRENEKVVIEIDINDVFQSLYSTII